MSIPDRSRFKNAIENVSPILRDILSKISTRDVYATWPHRFVPCTDNHITSRTHRLTYSSPIHRFDICRSLTRQITLSDRPADVSRNKMSQLHNLRGRLMRDVLASFCGLPLMLNLRRFSIEYHAPYTFRQPYGLSPVSHQFDVARIRVKLSNITAWILDMICSTSTSPEDEFLSARRPQIEFASATSDEGVNRMLYLSPHLELIEDVKDVDLRILESSAPLDDECILIHGPFNLYIRIWDWVEHSSKESTMTVIGDCMALVLPANKARIEKGATIDKRRKPYMFVRRQG